jgi:phosphatidylglycerophosphate synthase
MKLGKQIADFLTIIRGLLGIAIVAFGVFGGKDALPLVVVTLVLAWLTDLLDGVFARLDPNPAPGRLAQHDAKADMAVGLGVMAYLALSGYVPLWLGALITLLALVVRIWHSRALAFPFYAISFVLLGVVIWQQQPELFVIIAAYLLIVFVLRWRRLRDEYLPEFFEALSSLRSKQR